MLDRQWIFLGVYCTTGGHNVPEAFGHGQVFVEQQFFVFHEKKLAPRTFDPKLEVHGNERLTLRSCLEPQLRMPASFKVGRRNPSEPPFPHSNFPMYLRSCLKYLLQHHANEPWSHLSSSFLLL